MFAWFRSHASSALVVLLLAVAPGAATAQACNFEVDSFTALPDRVVLGVLRCLVRELDNVRRENAALRRDIEELKALMTQLPANYSNVDGVVTEEVGRAIGRASFVLTARTTGGASVMPLEQRVLDEVCGKSGGCSVTLAFRKISLFDAETKDSVLTGPCTFTYAPGDGKWSLGAGCNDGPRSGKDGDQSAGDDGTTDAVLVRSGGACLFAESDPVRAVGTDTGFHRDHSIGLYLVAMPSLQPDGIRRFECELVLN